MPDSDQPAPGSEGMATAPSARDLAALEQRIGTAEVRQVGFATFREEVADQLRQFEARLVAHSGMQDFQGQIDGVKSQLAAFGIELHQGLPQMTAAVQTNQQELAVMKETSEAFMRGGRALQADLERLKAELITVHAQAQFAAAASAPLPAEARTVA